MQHEMYYEYFCKIFPHWELPPLHFLPWRWLLNDKTFFGIYVTKQTSKFKELWSPTWQQIWPWDRSRTPHGTNRKGLSQWLCMPNINALSLILQKIWARLKFLWQTEGQMSFNVPHFCKRRETTNLSIPWWFLWCPSARWFLDRKWTSLYMWTEPQMPLTFPASSAAWTRSG